MPRNLDSIVKKALENRGYLYRYDPRSRTTTVEFRNVRSKQNYGITIRHFKRSVIIESLIVQSHDLARNAKPRLFQRLLELNHILDLVYDVDQLGNVGASTAISEKRLTADIFEEEFETVRLSCSTFWSSILPDFPELFGSATGKSIHLLFPGRFQPLHSGHVSVLRSLVLADPRILTRPSDLELLRRADKLIIGVGPLDRTRTTSDPLLVGERLTLLEAAIAEDPILSQYAYKIQLWLSPGIYDTPEWLPLLISSLPIRPKGIISGNTRTYQAAKDYGRARAILVKRRTGGISGTQVRKLIEQKKFTEATRKLPSYVSRIMAQDGLFQKMYNVLSAK